jgi:O-antigen biosynthesis protein WbqP
MYTHLKRILDFLLALMALVLLSPLLLVLAVVIRATSPGPVFFRQKRVGLGKSHFMIYKFRTMRTDAPKDQPTHLLKDPAAYITPVGRFLRRSSLDELPQLLNIIKGEMAVVGPRPALWNQFDLIAERDKYGANDVRPGLTGWAQINGRDELPIDVKARLDGEYVRRMSFGFDVRCVLGTVLKVLRSDGVVEGTQSGKTKAIQTQTQKDETNAGSEQ